MRFSSTTFLRICALIFIAIGAYGIYSWQMKAEKVKEVAPALPAPWYYYAIPLMLLIIFGWTFLARHPFKSPARKTLAILALFGGVAYLGVKTVDSIDFKWPKSNPNPSVYQPPPPMTQTKPVRQAPQPNYQPPPERQEAAQQPAVRQRSYEECWQIAHRAYTNNSVAVPPECSQAWQDYKRRQEEIAEQNRRNEAEERERQERAERDQRAEEDRQRRIAEQERREQERAARDADYRRQQQERERQRRIDEWANRIKKVIRRP